MLANGSIGRAVTLHRPLPPDVTFHWLPHLFTCISATVHPKKKCPRTFLFGISKSIQSAKSLRGYYQIIRSVEVLIFLTSFQLCFFAQYSRQNCLTELKVLLARELYDSRSDI